MNRQTNDPNNRPTFPLDPKDVRSRKRSGTIGHPLTWLVPGAVFMVPLLIMRGHPIGLLAGLVAGSAALAGMLFYWMGRGAAVEQRVIDKIIRERHQAQDAALLESVRELRAGGHENYAATLERFLGMKQSFAMRLHHDGELTDKKKELNNLADTVCFHVSDQLHEVVALEKPLRADNRADRPLDRPGDQGARDKLVDTRRQILAQVVDAFETLEETHENLDQILNPEILDPDSARRRADGLQNAIDSLQQESKVASAVKNILRETESEDLPLDLDFE